MEIGDQMLTNPVFPAEHTTESIAKTLQGILEQWGLDPTNQTYTTTDNGSNIFCAILSHLVWPYLSCFGHNLHLAISNSIKGDTRVQRALGICRKIVKHLLIATVVEKM